MIEFVVFGFWQQSVRPFLCQRGAWFGWVVVATLADQGLKWWAVNTLQSPIDVIPWVLRWQLTWNTGVAFGLLRHHPAWAVLLSTLLTLVLLVAVGVWLTAPRQPSSQALLLKMGGVALASGALSNALDRWFRGAVVDFINFYTVGFPVFNGADVMVCLGLFLWWWALSRSDRAKHA